jgi:hypothetical protein
MALPSGMTKTARPSLNQPRTRELPRRDHRLRLEQHLDLRTKLYVRILKSCLLLFIPRLPFAARSSLVILPRARKLSRDALRLIFRPSGSVPIPGRLPCGCEAIPWSALISWTATPSFSNETSPRRSCCRGLGRWGVHPEEVLRPTRRTLSQGGEPPTILMSSRRGSWSFKA